MENNEVKVIDHENQLPTNLRESCDHSDEVVYNGEQSKENNIINNVDETNNDDKINETTNEVSKQLKDIMLNLTATVYECLTSVNLSNNRLKEVPAELLTLKYIVSLNLSHNKIIKFDESPSCLHTLQELSLANNSLAAPPLWIWKESPQALNHLDISNNECIVKYLKDKEKFEFLNCTLTVNTIILYNCRIHEFKEILLTLVDVKDLSVGYYDYTVLNINKISEFPSENLECYNVEKLHLSNINLYNINERINNYTSLTYLDLSSNRLTDLPNNFGDLKLLEICKLSFNKILYLPDTLLNLKKLKALYIDNNVLYVLPKKLLSLPELKCVDMYKNIFENNPLEVYDQLDEVDFAQNCFNEPESSAYIEKKSKLRNNLGVEGRFNGKRDDINVKQEQDSSECDSDYSLPDEQDSPKEPVAGPVHVESEEDWDSDSYWEPSFLNRYYIEKRNPWQEFLNKKLKEGNFCPADLHEPSILDKVNYMRSLQPQQPFIPVEGQFDDMSDDDSLDIFNNT